MANLLPISGTDNAKRHGDVVFVHGLDGDARETWYPKKHPDAFWPDWLGEDLPDLGVWSLGYDVSASAWKGHSMPLVDRATNTMELFDLDAIGQRPLAFICHSLGGLLVKQILRLARESNKPEQRAMADSTKLIVFLSTPHSGADMARWVEYLGTLLRTTVSIEELTAHHPRLLELNRWYRNQAGNIGIETFVYCEKLKTAGILVVNQTTADPGIPDVDVVPLDEDHVTICKPPNRDAIVYRRVKRLLEQNFTGGDPARKVAEPPEVDPHASRSPASATAMFSGDIQYRYAERLGDSWRNLATVLEIPASDERRFEGGDEARAIWQWLHNHGRLAELPRALGRIDRDDLARLFAESSS